jgi:hypothetical protein
MDSFRIKAISLQGEEFDYFTSFKLALDTNLLLASLSESFLESLLDNSDNLDNRVSMISRNLVEFFTDTIYGKKIVFPTETVIRSKEKVEPGSDFSISPNPLVAGNMVHFNSHYTGKAFIFTASGHLLNTYLLDHSNSIPIEGFELYSGLYIFLIAEESGERHMAKLMIVNP